MIKIIKTVLIVLVVLHVLEFVKIVPHKVVDIADGVFTSPIDTIKTLWDMLDLLRPIKIFSGWWLLAALLGIIGAVSISSKSHFLIRKTTQLITGVCGTASSFLFVWWWMDLRVAVLQIVFILAGLGSLGFFIGTFSSDDSSDDEGDDDLEDRNSSGGGGFSGRSLSG